MAGKVIKTYKDIQDAVLEELKIPTSDSTTVDRIKRDINVIYQDLASRKRWDWLRKFITLSHKKYISGTASMTTSSRSVTLSAAPAISVKGYWLKVSGHEEIYRVAAHTAGAATAVLETEFTGSTNASIAYKLWTDRIPLPTDCVETVEVSHQWLNYPMDNVGPQQLRRQRSAQPDEEDYPRCYSTNDYKDPNPYSTATTATLTRSSSGLVKTVVFDSDMSATLEVGSKIQVSGASDPTYNGEFKVRSISTDTITYTGLVALEEASTADTGMSISKLGVKTAEETYRELWVYPSLYPDHDITLHVDYVQSIDAMEADTDEPLLPAEDRVILKYGALMQSWIRHRNPEMASANQQLFETKYARMAAKTGDSSDNPNIMTDHKWARRKKYRRYQKRYRY